MSQVQECDCSSCTNMVIRAKFFILIRSLICLSAVSMVIALFYMVFGTDYLLEIYSHGTLPFTEYIELVSYLFGWCFYTISLIALTATSIIGMIIFTVIRYTGGDEITHLMESAVRSAHGSSCIHKVWFYCSSGLRYTWLREINIMIREFDHVCEYDYKANP